MKEKRITKKPKILYHLSTENHDGEWFKPRVPLSIYKNLCGSSEHDEDDKTKRVCFSRYIRRAFFAISFDGIREHLYVHVPVGLDDIVRRGKLYKPTEEQVFDVSTTDEYWIKCTVKMKCIGKISIAYSGFYPKFKMYWMKRFN